MKKNLSNDIEIENHAKDLSKRCKKQLKLMYKEGHTPETALLEIIEFVPLKNLGPITHECASAILYLELKRRFFSGEEQHYVH